MMWLNKITQWVNQGIPCAIVTIIKAEGSVPRGVGAKLVVNELDDSAGSVGGGPVEHISRQQAIKCIRENRCVTLNFSLAGDLWQVTEDQSVQGRCGGTVAVFIEPILPKPEVVIFGGGHIGEALGKLCDVLKIPYRVFDNREEFVSMERFPSAVERICQPYESLSNSIHLTRTSYCVVLTHGHLHDRSCLEQIAPNREVPYIGMIGSRHKVKAIIEDIRSQGGVIDQRVYSPVGLKIARNLPEEIALSIISEIVMVINSGSPEHMRG
jgi:xanthine dehydrogenase accessory factor